MVEMQHTHYFACRMFIHWKPAASLHGIGRSSALGAMGPREAHGRGPHIPEWATGAAARLDAVTEEFERQTAAREAAAAAAAADDAVAGDAQEHRDTDGGDAARGRSSGRSPERTRSGGTSGGVSRRRESIEPTAMPSDVDTRRAGVLLRGVPGFAEGVQPRPLPSTPSSELAALRLAGAKPHAFAPWRHAVMVCGRPVVVLSCYDNNRSAASICLLRFFVFVNVWCACACVCVRVCLCACVVFCFTLRPNPLYVLPHMFRSVG